MHKIKYSFIIMLVNCVVMSANSFADSYDNEFFEPIPEKIELDSRKVELGRKLFHDTRLSGNNKFSCASCHAIDQGGVVPGEKHSIPGVSGKTVPINIPTVFNSGFNHTQFWDGRAKTLEEQIDGPTHNPDEMGSNWKDILAILKLDKQYKKEFYDIYRNPMTEKTVKNAIATFEKSLITPNSPFDNYLKGQLDAMSPKAKEGYQLFQDYGCVSCHQGRNLGGNMFQTMGIMGDYFKDRGSIIETDMGRYNVTGREEDKHVFRVPSLRNIALTPPYFHDGSAASLEDAVDVMAKYQLGRDLSKQEREALVEFLKNLTGVYKEGGK
jgi:cytochrome c peroxidase